MRSTEEKIMKNPDLYKEHLEIYKYFIKNENCIICQHKVSMEMIRMNDNGSTKEKLKNNTKIQNERKNTEKQMEYDCDFLIWLDFLKLKSFIRPQDKLLENKEIFIDEVETYCSFLSCFDLNLNGSFIKRFDLSIFATVLINEKFSDQNDQVIQSFLRKIQVDPFIYEKQQKIQGLNLEIFSFIFMTKNKLDTKILKKRIEEHAFLFKPDPKFIVELTGDLFVDKMIIQLRKNTLNLSQAIFLNQVYLNVSKDKEYFDLFHKSLTESLKTIEVTKLFSFLKHVFTYRTILFTCIQEEQLIRLIISFYKNMNRLENSIGILIVLFNRIPSVDINIKLKDELKEWCSKSKKHSKTLKLIDLRSLTELSQMKSFIKENNESFDTLNILFGQIKLISQIEISQAFKLQLVEILLEMFSNIKSEFLERFLSPMVSLIIQLMENILISSELIQFNKNSWDILSDLILTCQKEETDDNKKKKGDVQRTEKCKGGMKLAKLLYSIEDELMVKGTLDFIRLKKRSFKIE